MKKLLILLSILACLPVFAQYQTVKPAPSLDIINAGHRRVVVKVNGRSIFENNPGADVKYNMADYVGKTIRITVDIMQRELFGWSVKSTFFFDCVLDSGEQWQLMLGDDKGSTILKRTYPEPEDDIKNGAGSWGSLITGEEIIK